MRFLYPLLLVACAVSAAPTPAPDPPRPVVLFVHGRGQLGQDTAALRREWKRDLDSSLALVGLPRLADNDVRLAWYADVLDPETDAGCTVARSDSMSLDFSAFTRVLLGSLTSAIPERESRDARGVIGDILYLVDPWTRCAAQRRVGRAIESAITEGRPVVVVAYSLGSVVTYGYLRDEMRAKGRSAELRLVTLGSPLGVRDLRAFVLPDAIEITHPAGVASWTNVYDPDDFFAAPIGRNSIDRRVEDVATRSAADGYAHGVSRYLRDRSTGAAVARALCATAQARFGDACARLEPR